jgi:hypothetical protein
VKLKLHDVPNHSQEDMTLSVLGSFYVTFRGNDQVGGDILVHVKCHPRLQSFIGFGSQGNNQRDKRLGSVVDFNNDIGTE